MVRSSCQVNAAPAIQVKLTGSGTKLMKMSARLLAWALAVLCLWAGPAFGAESGLSASDRILQNELKQQQIRATTQRVGEQLGAVVAEFDRNGIGGEDVKTLKIIRGVLGYLTEKDMQTVIEYLQQARTASDAGGTSQKTSEAFAKQKAIILQLKQLVLEYQRQQALSEIAIRLKELARRQSENMRLGVWLARLTDRRSLDGFDESQKLSLQLQHTEQGALKDEVALVIARLETLSKEIMDGPMADRPKVALQQARDGGLKPALDAAVEEIKTAKLLSATGNEKKARDQMREVARLLMLSKDASEALRQALRELDQAIAEQQQVAVETAKLEKETVSQTESQQAEVADTTDLIKRDVADIAPVAADSLKEAFNKMQEARSILNEQGRNLEQKRAEAPKKQAEALAGLEQARRALQEQLAKAEALEIKPEDKLAAMKELQEQVRALIKQEEQVKQETAASETRKQDLQKDAPRQGELKDKAQELQQQAADKSPPAAQSLGEAAGQMQKAQTSLAEGKNNPAAQQAALDALNQADKQFSQDIAKLEDAQKELAQLEEMLKKLGIIINDEQKSQFDTAKAALKNPTPPTKDLAEKQDKLAKDTGDLKKEAETPVPAAASHLGKAQEQMDAAKGNLDSTQPAAAQPHQTQALSELYAAKKEIEAKADQLREQLGLPQNDNAQALADAAAAIEQAQKDVSQAMSELSQSPPGLLESLQKQQQEIANALADKGQNTPATTPLGQAQKAASQAAQQLAKSDLPGAIGEMKKAQGALQKAQQAGPPGEQGQPGQGEKDRKSTRLNSSHGYI